MVWILVSLSLTETGIGKIRRKLRDLLEIANTSYLLTRETSCMIHEKLKDSWSKSTASTRGQTWLKSVAYCCGQFKYTLLKVLQNWGAICQQLKVCRNIIKVQLKQQSLLPHLRRRLMAQNLTKFECIKPPRTTWMVFNRSHSPAPTPIELMCSACSKHL